MQADFPVRLENGLVISGDEEPFMINQDPDFPGVNGNDANGDRFTNIVGFDGSELLKRCTKCHVAKPSTAGYGEGGRNSNPSKSMRRDQAQCVTCRNS